MVGLVMIFVVGFLSVSASGSPAPETFAAFDVGEIRDASRAAATVAGRVFNRRRRDGHDGRGERRNLGGVKKSEQPIGFGFGFDNGSHLFWFLSLE